MQGVLWTSESLRTANIWKDPGFAEIVDLVLKIGRDDKTVSSSDILCHPTTLRRNIDVTYEHLKTLLSAEIAKSVADRIPPAFTTDLTTDDTTYRH